MLTTHPPTEYRDPDQLLAQAREFLGDGFCAGTAAEELFRRAYARFAADLDALDRAAGDAPAILGQFGAQLHEKLAALLFIARHTLRELADPPHTVDIEFARRDMTLYVDLLARVGALEGLGALYDFAAGQDHAASPGFWPSVCRHLLTLMARAPEGQVLLPGFLAARPAAQQHLRESIAGAPEAELLRALLAEAGRDGRSKMPEPARYLLIYRQYGDDTPCDCRECLCALTAARHHIERAFTHGDLPAVKHWFAEGSRGAAREVLRLGEAGLSVRRRARLLEEFLNMPECDGVRRTAAVLELGTLNLGERPEGGQAEINRALVECAMSEDDACAGVARAAVREMVTVRNSDALLFVASRAPLLAVAEEAVAALKDMRRLRLVEPLLRARPELTRAYRAAHQQLVEIQNLVEAVWSAPADQTDIYLERLKQLNAGPELDRLQELLQRNRVFL
ncbi:MAG: hypothetical protein ACYDCO_11500 [Armatimonadota bacterium]